MRVQEAPKKATEASKMGHGAYKASQGASNIAQEAPCKSAWTLRDDVHVVERILWRAAIALPELKEAPPDSRPGLPSLMLISLRLACDPFCLHYGIHAPCNLAQAL